MSNSNKSAGLFQTKRFLPLFVTQYFGAFSDNAFKNALVILITYRVALNSAAGAGILVTIASGLFILPYFLFSATAGQLADKYDRAKLTRIYKIIEIILMVMAVVSFYLENMWFLLVILFSMGAQSTFFGPIKYALLPQHIHPNELMSANAYIEGATFVAILTGTIAGGVLILQNHGALKVSLLLMLSAVVGYTSSRFIPPAPGGAPDLVIKKNFLAQTAVIVKEVTKNRLLTSYLLMISWFWLLGSIFLAQTAIFAKDTLYADEKVVTTCLALFSIGIATGAVLCNRLSKGKASLKFVAAGAFGMAFSTLLLVALAGRFPATADVYVSLPAFLYDAKSWGVLASLFAIACFGGIYTVPLYTLIQTESDKAYIARTIAANNIFNSFFMVVSVVVVVILYSIGFNVLHIFALSAAVNIALGIFIYTKNKGSAAHAAD